MRFNKESRYIKDGKLIRNIEYNIIEGVLFITKESRIFLKIPSSVDIKYIKKDLFNVKFGLREFIKGVDIYFIKYLLEFCREPIISNFDRDLENKLNKIYIYQEELIKCSSVIEKILKKLYFLGYRPFLVGGCVRDCLLKREINDYDIVVNASLEEVLRKLGFGRIIGRNIPILTIKFNKVDIEISSMKNEKREISRESSIFEDYISRNFTVNSIYFDYISNCIIDPCGYGVQDISKKIIRTISKDPKDFLYYDKPSIFNVLRMMLKLGFKLDPKINKLITNLETDFFIDVNKDRLRHEFNKLKICPGYEKMLKKYNLNYAF